MKIKHTKGFATQQPSQRKKVSNPKFGTLLASELETSEATETTTFSNLSPDQTTNTHTQSLALFEQAYELLEQALTTLEDGEKPTLETLESIQSIRKQLDALCSNQSADTLELSQAKTLLAVETQRIQSIKH